MVVAHYVTMESAAMDKYIYRAKLDRVVDGDTVDALIDVGFDIWVKKKGLAAKARVIELLAETSAKPGYFRLKSYGVGKYGRVLGELFIQDSEGKQYNINETLKTEGHAYEYHGGKKQVFKG